MGGAVSSGRDNNELIDNLMGGNYIRTRQVERVFRALDRAEYMTPDSRDQAYKDLAWRNGSLHMSAPCIYSEVLEGLELKPGLSFLNVGSGTGYLSTLVGLIIGSSGINHGVEVHPYVLEYAIKKLGQFIENSPILDEFDFCVPKFYSGNGMCLAPLQAPYDRLYCGAGCPLEFHNYFKQLIKIGGVLVMPLSDNLVQIKRTSVDGWSSRNLLNVSFATLRLPTKEEAKNLIKLEEQCPARLQLLCRAVVRESMRASLLSRHPHLREPPPKPMPPGNNCPRRICIPIEDDSDVEGLNALHDLDNVNGANEMNALLSLVLSMGQNRVAGALRFDSLESLSSSSSDDDDDAADDDNDDDDDDDYGPDGPEVPREPESGESSRPEPPTGTENSDPVERSERYEQPDHRRSSSEPPPSDDTPKPTRYANIQIPGTIRTHHSLITFEIQDSSAKSAGSSRTADSSHDSEEPGNSRDPRKRKDMRGVPAEVEIYLGKERAGTSRTVMEWEASDDRHPPSTSEEDTTETSKEKRKKLDSGIGEGTTTSSGSSPAKSDTNDADESEIEVRRPVSDDENVGGRRRRLKRSRCAGGGCSDGASRSTSRGSERARLRRKRRLAEHARAMDELRPRRSPDARRVRLSILMKRGVKDLPLPYALKKYVNLGRCFEF